jgi:ribosome-binding protein aMBF1 (putative translation factor)
MTDHALKVARDIALECAERICSRGFESAHHYLRDQFAEYIEQAIQEATGPYRELAEKWGRKTGVTKLEQAHAHAYRKCSKELEALLLKETK